MTDEERATKEKKEIEKKEYGKTVEGYFSDSLMEIPYAFSVMDGEKKVYLYLYPVTLGKMLLLQRHIEAIGIEPKNIVKNELLEMLRVAHTKKEECLKMIYIHTCKTKDEVFDEKLKAERMELFNRVFDNDDIATLILATLSTEHINEIVKHYGMDKEHDAMQVVARVKNSKNDLSFGGKTLMGSFICQLLELGFTYEEIVWERSYSTLRLLLADKITSIYVSDDELSRLPSSVKHHNDDIIRPTKENMEAIKSMDWR